MKLGIPVYEGVDLLDVAGPYEMFTWVDASKGLETVIISADGGPVTTRANVRLGAHASFAATKTLHVLWVPGGDPKVLAEIMRDLNSPYLAYCARLRRRRKWVCSVCEGALLLARAGLLDGNRATNPLGVPGMSRALSQDPGGYHPSALHRLWQSADRRRDLIRAR